LAGGRCARPERLSLRCRSKAGTSDCVEFPSVDANRLNAIAGFLENLGVVVAYQIGNRIIRGWSR
jgi:hypothetical protein